MAQAIKKQRRYSVEDYQEWSDDEKWEIIDGILYDMSPAPRIKHQNIVGNFFLNFKTHPENPCYTGIAPTDVVLDAYSVVQPDVFIVCDGGKITENNIQGAPDLIVEVVSPGTEVKDRREKKRLYEQSGVKEYLIVFPEREYVERYVLEEGQYGSPEIFNWDERLRLSIFPIEVKLDEIFEKENQTEAQERPAP
ncbi:MAG: Uma2 family endonuclease [Deltaproteobacteria bacterium]|nr:Uma2 family endonuclease [Deltaproteobacteria bacterium]